METLKRQMFICGLLRLHSHRCNPNCVLGSDATYIQLFLISLNGLTLIFSPPPKKTSGRYLSKQEMEVGGGAPSIILLNETLNRTHEWILVQIIF